MGTGIDTSTASARAQRPGGASIRRTTLRVAISRTLEGRLGWLRRELRRLLRRVLANDPQTTAIRQAVGWASLAGGALGVVLAFVAPEPVEADHAASSWRARPSYAIAHRPLTPRSVARQPPPSEASIRVETAAAASTEYPAREAVGPSAAPPLIAADARPPETSGPAVSATRGEKTSASKAHRRDGPSTSTLPSGTSPAGDRGADADELVWLAERAFQAGHPAEAVRLGQKALAAGGGARAQLTIAGAYFDMREFDRARGAYEAVLAEEPGNQAARTGLDISRSALARSIARAP